jgi:predicted phosphodiesterase
MSRVNKSQLARQLIEKHPTASTASLARMLYESNPALFNEYERARDAVRYARGTKGASDKWTKANLKKNRETVPQSEYNEGLVKIPKPKDTWDEAWEAVKLTGRRILCLSDIHVPYHDQKALETALNFGMDEGADTVLLNGDFMDFFSVSRYETDPRQRDLAGEIEMGREMLQILRESFKGCQIIWKLGNHEERWEAFMYRKAPEILGVDDFELESILRCKQHNVRVIGEMRPLKVANLNILHGHEYKYAISNPVNPARGLYNKAKALATMGHLHQTSEHTENNINGKVITCWSSGCLCHLRPRYSPLNKWNHGFQFIDLTQDEDFILRNFKILNGRIY